MDTIVYFSVNFLFALYCLFWLALIVLLAYYGIKRLETYREERKTFSQRNN